MERPSVANVPTNNVLVVASVPQPDMLLCDKLILRAEKGGSDSGDLRQPHKN